MEKNINPLSETEARHVIKRMYELTNPIKPHEERIIANILQTKNHQRDWRFKNHVFCKGCNRELTILDMFLSGLNHHSPKFIHDYLYENGPSGGKIVYDDGTLPKIQVFTHGLQIVCVNCGSENASDVPARCDLYFYKRPVKGRCDISMSVYWLEKLLGETKPKE